MAVDFDIVRSDTFGAKMLAIASGLTQDMPKLVFRAAQHAEGIGREVIMRTFPEGRTGKLARSWRASFLGYEGDVVAASVSSDAVQARILDEGGTIRPKTTKFLAVPFPGVRIPVGKWPRHFSKDELRFIPSFGGRAPMLVKFTGKKRTMKPMFSLLKSVRIRARNYVDRIADESQPGIEEITSNSVGATLDRSIGSGE